MNINLLDQALARIDAHPDEWDQETWRCGTSMCLAGHTAVAAGLTWIVDDTMRTRADLPAAVWDRIDELPWFLPGETQVLDPDNHPDELDLTYQVDSIPDVGVLHVSDAARVRLGISHGQAADLFHCKNTRRALQQMRDALAADPDADLGNCRSAVY